jgi:hypothetical protein
MNSYNNNNNSLSTKTNCTNSCCNCQKNMPKKRKKHNETITSTIISSNNSAAQKEKQILSKYKKLKTSNHSARNQLRLNISSNDALTPVSLSSLSPQSVKSNNLSPIESPFLNQHSSSQHQTAFNYYPIEMVQPTNLFPFYYSAAAPPPFASNNSAFTPQPQHSQPQPQSNHNLSSDPTYIQNLINTIYSLANYQQLQATHQQQQQHQPLINTNNLILYSIQQQLHKQQQQQQHHQQTPSNVFNPQLIIQSKEHAKPFVKSKLISYINESEIENKVNEHFRRSLGSKYLKINYRLNRLNNGIRLSNKSNVNVINNKNDTKTNNNKSTDANDKNEIYYYENDETFIEFPNDEQTNINSFSPTSTDSVLSDTYTQQSRLNEVEEGASSAGTDVDDFDEDESNYENKLIYSPPLSSNC